MMRTTRALLAAGLSLLLVACASPATPPDGPAQRAAYTEPAWEGPFHADVNRFIDAWRMNIRFLGGPLAGEVRFRLADVHTPSVTSDQACEVEEGRTALAFARDFVGHRRVEIRELRRGRDTESVVGRLYVDGRSLSEALLDAKLAVPYHDSWRNPALRRWDCAWNGNPPAAWPTDG
jgi:endonuclease YncB( thermonuclease family)